MCFFFIYRFQFEIKSRSGPCTNISFGIFERLVNNGKSDRSYRLQSNRSKFSLQSSDKSAFSQSYTP